MVCDDTPTPAEVHDGAPESAGLFLMADLITVDRSGWPPGPWDGEPFDRQEWVDPDTGLGCLVRRGPLGAWCGYVAVNDTHPWYEVDHTIPAGLVGVHGGLTYSGPCRPEVGICHTPAPGDTDRVWWFGFDCAHFGDIVPRLLVAADGLDFAHARYRTVDYARAECTCLARQLAEHAC